MQSFLDAAIERANNIKNRGLSGFHSQSAWRFIIHKIILWATIFSPLYITRAYGAVNINTKFPNFISDFFSSATNLGWILGVPILSSTLVSGLFCIIGANELKLVAIDDARRSLATVAAIWIFLGIFFLSLNSKIAISAGCDLIGAAIFIGGFRFLFWGLTENQKP